MGRTKRIRKSKSRKNNDDVSYSEIIGLQKWLNLKHFYMKVVSYDGAGRGVISKENISAGEELIAVPLKFMITLGTVNQSDMVEMFTDPFEKPQVALSFYLVYQRHLKNLSSFEKYMNVLPQSYSNLISCTEEEIDALPMWMKRMVRSKLADIKENFVSSIGNLQDGCCSHCNLPRASLFSFEDFFWAWSTVNTRGVYYVDDSTTSDGVIKSTASMAMAPFIDFYNHSNDADVEAKLDIQRGVYSLTTRKPYSKYEQIFIKYGVYSNLRLLIEYGFILDDLSQDVVEFTFEEVLKAAKAVDYHYADISKLKYKFITMNNLNTSLNKSRDEFSWNCNGLLYILVTQDTNLGEILSKTYSSTWSEKEEIIMSEIRRELVSVKEEVLKKELLAMDRIAKPSEGFVLAKDLIKQYLKILRC